MSLGISVKRLRISGYLILVGGLAFIALAIVAWIFEQIYPIGGLIFGTYLFLVGLGTILLTKRNPLYGNAYFNIGGGAFFLFLAFLVPFDIIFIFLSIAFFSIFVINAILPFYPKTMRKLQLKFIRSKKADALLKNYWERFNIKKIRIMASVGIVILAIFLWIFQYIVITSLYSLFAEVGIVSQDSDFYMLTAVVITIIDIIIIGIVVIFYRRFERKHRDWYASGLLDTRLDRLEVLDMIRSLLTHSKYFYTETEKRHLWPYRRTTHFESSRNNFRLGLDFFESSSMRAVAIYIGPETILNKKQLQELRNRLSEEFGRRYGSSEL